MQNRQEILPTLQQNKRGTNQRYFVRSYFVPHLFCADASIFSHPPPCGGGILKFTFLLLFSFHSIFSFAQQANVSNPNYQAQPPLSEKAKQQIEQNIVNTAAWDRLNELKSLVYNFPQMSHSLNPQIEEIYETYRFTYRPSMQEMREQEQWQIQQQNQKLLQQFNNTPKPSKEDIAEIQQYQQQGKAPQQNNQQRLQKEMFNVLQELRNDEAKLAQTDYYHSQEYLQDVPNYNKAKELLKNMLEGKIPLSIKDAYFFEEAAYGNLHLTYEEYNKLIADNAQFIKQWLKENKYDANDAEMLHYGIQKFMSDTIYITVNGKKQGHAPYYYDYIDAFAEKDKRNYFVTKTLATGGGQCKTMPIIYMILAEYFGIEVNLGYNPHHTFIRYPNKKGTIINYEATIGRIMPNQWYSEVVPIMAKNQQNGIYVNSLSKHKIIATRLFDLAQNFMEEHGLGNKPFIQECLDIATPYFPNEEFICTANYNIKKTLYAYAFNSLVKLHNLKSMSEIENYEDVTKAYHTFYDYVEKINSLGVQDFPDSEYMQLLSYYDTRGKLQTAKKIDGKTKKSLFIK